MKNKGLIIGISITVAIAAAAIIIYIAYRNKLREQVAAQSSLPPEQVNKMPVDQLLATLRQLEALANAAKE